jgi:hypothetical protein
MKNETILSPNTSHRTCLQISFDYLDKISVVTESFHSIINKNVRLFE